jgi:hypothetical protein
LSYKLVLSNRKAEGANVKDHPVILQLVRSRTLLERLRPLDKKLAYQVNNSSDHAIFLICDVIG